VAQSSANLLSLLTVVQNHDLQVRFRWEENSLAIWDNRSTFRTFMSQGPQAVLTQADAATHDLDDTLREGTRSVSLGERPYLDPKSTGRREALAQEQK
jgi:hypothetical protein